MEKTFKVETEDFILEIKKWTNKTRKMAILAHESIADDLGIKKKETSYKNPKKSEKVPPTHPSNTLKRKPGGQFKTMLPKEDLVEKYGHAPVYGVIIKYILDHLEGEVRLIDIAKKIQEFYKFKLNKPILMHTARTYAATYTRVMEKRKEIKRLKRNVFFIDKKKEELSDRIYRLALKKGWLGTRSVPIKTIMEETGSEEEAVTKAISKLIKKNRAIQLPENKIKF